MEMHEIDVVFTPANTTSVLQPLYQGVILTFKSSDLRNTMGKTIAATDNDSSERYGQSPLKNFLEMNHHFRCHYQWFMGRSQNTNISLEEVASILNDAFEGFKTSVEEVHLWWKQQEWELEFEVQLKTWLRCGSLVIKLEQMRSCFLRISTESGFSGWNLFQVKMLWRLLKQQQEIDNITYS